MAELQTGLGAVDTLQQSSQVIGILHVFNIESDGIGTTFQGVNSDGIRFVQISLGHFLHNLPVIIVFFRSTGIRELSRHRVKIIQIFQVFGTIIGAHIETLIGAPNQFLLIVGSF